MQKWSELLSQDSLQKAAALSEKAQSERDAGRTIYPPQSQIFRALELTPPEQVRVVIVGQDPYHGPGQANGLAFSVNPGVPLPAVPQEDLPRNEGGYWSKNAGVRGSDALGGERSPPPEYRSHCSGRAGKQP